MIVEFETWRLQGADDGTVDREKMIRGEGEGKKNDSLIQQDEPKIKLDVIILQSSSNLTDKEVKRSNFLGQVQRSKSLGWTQSTMEYFSHMASEV